MNKLIIIVFCILITFVIQSCEKDKIVQNPISEIYFDVKKSNSDKNYSTTVEKIINTAERTSRFHFGKDSAILIQEIQFDLQLKYGDSIKFGFWLIGYEDPELLNLGEYDSVYFQGEDWDYINSDNEIRNFYNGFKEARVLINNSNVIFHHNQNDNFKILKAEEIFSDGKYKTYLEITFDGTAYGVYDPLGMYQEVYTITNGIFKGIIE